MGRDRAMKMAGPMPSSGRGSGPVDVALPAVIMPSETAQVPKCKTIDLKISKAV